MMKALSLGSCQRTGAIIVAWIIVLVSGSPNCLWAAGGAENLLLVVNADSPSSLLIANHYIVGRKIPARNVVYLTGIPDSELTTLDVFRNRILQPVLAEIEKRQLASSIDYIVYSADFPTTINVTPHRNQLTEALEQAGEIQLDRRLFYPMASINSLTYFASAVLRDQPGYLLLDSNYYYRLPAEFLLQRPFVGELQRRYSDAVKQLDQQEGKALRDTAKVLRGMVQQNPGQLAAVYQLARCEAKLGNAANATRWLIRAVQLGWRFRSKTRSDPAFGPILEDPLFSGVLERIEDQPFDFVPTHGFKARYSFGPNGMINAVPGQGNRHFLSTVLAVTRNHGNTEKESVEQLQRTMLADATSPQGTFYFTQTRSVRTTTRQPNVAAAITALKALGHNAEVIPTKLPQGKTQVLGLTCGTSRFNWLPTQSRFQPGAIAENLTSFGGRLRSHGQTKLTEFLAHGAAGSSGTVVEPYALQAKFPHPMIHVHYARGCTLAEAFYQSVQGPFQLLIVGDPLCRPFAKLPRFGVNGVKAGQVVKGKLELEIDATESPVRIRGLQLFVDGRLTYQQVGLGKLRLDTMALSDGYHELRVVAIEDSLIGITQAIILPVHINNQGHAVNLEINRQRVPEEGRVRLTADANVGSSIGLYCHGRLIDRQPGREVVFDLPAKVLGRGPVSLTAVALMNSAGSSRTSSALPAPSSDQVSSSPVELMVVGRLAELRRSTAANKSK